MHHFISKGKKKSLGMEEPVVVLFGLGAAALYTVAQLLEEALPMVLVPAIMQLVPVN